MTETEGKWAERVRRWRASGQTAAEFTRGKGYEPSTLRYWACMLNRRPAGAVKVTARSPAAPAVRMLRVRRVARAAEPMVVAVGAARVEVPAGFDQSLLRAIIEAIGAAP
jgi:hypothetical protein